MFIIRFLSKERAQITCSPFRKRNDGTHCKPFQAEITSKSIPRHTRTPSTRITVTSDSLQKNQRHPRKSRERSTPKREEETAGNHGTLGLSLFLSFSLHFSLLLLLLHFSLFLFFCLRLVRFSIRDSRIRRISTGRVAWVAGWVAGLVGDDDGVSSLARPEAADEVWEIAATLQSTKRRHRRPPALYHPVPLPLLRPSPSFLSRTLRSVSSLSLSLFTS